MEFHARSPDHRPPRVSRPHLRRLECGLQRLHRPPYLEPISTTSTVAPTIPSARFLWRAGQIQREDGVAFSLVDPLDVLVDKFIRIERINTSSGGDTTYQIYWDGIIADDSMAIGGGSGGENVADQTFTAYGLERLLDRISISYAWAVNGPADSETLIQIGWCPPFNESLDPRRQRDRQPVDHQAARVHRRHQQLRLWPGRHGRVRRGRLGAERHLDQLRHR